LNLYLLFSSTDKLPRTRHYHPIDRKIRSVSNMSNMLARRSGNLWSRAFGLSCIICSISSYSDHNGTILLDIHRLKMSNLAIC